VRVELTPGEEEENVWRGCGISLLAEALFVGSSPLDEVLQLKYRWNDSGALSQCHLRMANILGGKKKLEKRQTSVDLLVVWPRSVKMCPAVNTKRCVVD